MNAVVDVPADRFESDVLARSHAVPVVVDFWAPWCGPCRTLGPILEQLATQAQGRWVLAKVNSDHAPHLAQRYGVQGIPAVFAFVDGEVVAQFTGVRPPDWIAQWVDGFVPDPAEATAREGDDHAAAGRADAARAAWHAALDVDATNARARIGLAEDARAHGDAEAAARWIDGLGAVPAPLKTRLGALRLQLAGSGDVDALRATVDASPADLDARWDLAHALAAQAAWTDAIDALLTIVRQDRSYRDDGARKALLGWFDLLGNDHPAVRDGRRRLGQLLF